MDDMKAGGAERVISILANACSKEGYNVIFIVGSDKDSFYKLNSDIQFIKLLINYGNNTFFSQVKRNIIEITRLIKVLKVEKPDVFISFIRNVPAIIICKIVGIKVIVSERNNPIYDPPNKVWRILRKLIYPFATRIVFQTTDAKKYFSKSIQYNSCVIPNPINNDIYGKFYVEKEKIIVSVGRLSKQKDHETLIRAFSIVSKKFQNYKLVIYGEGNMRNRLEDIIHECGLEDNVFLPGKKENIYELMSKAEIFVLSSIYEGYPNAVIEAMALGLPVISTNCQYGPSEIITDGYNGLLVKVGDYVEMAQKIEYLIENYSKAEELAKNALTIRSKLKCEDIMKKWLKLMDDILQPEFNVCENSYKYEDG